MPQHAAAQEIFPRDRTCLPPTAPSFVPPPTGPAAPLVRQVHFLPEKHHKKPDTYYAAPLYKTTVRKGNLSSLGQSTNFVLAVEVPSDMSEDYWVQKGAALVCALND